MKNDEDDQKKQKLQEVDKKIDKRVENFMGPAPENANTIGDDPKSYKDGASGDTVPTSAPMVSGQAPVVEPQTKKKTEETLPKEPLDDPEVSEAVDDIAVKESDASLAAEDEAVKEAFEIKKPQGGKIRRFFRAWWNNKFARWATILIILGAAAAVAVFPSTRYYLLNKAGVRSQASVTVIDQSSRLPLKNVAVQLNNATGTTNDEGKVTLSQVMLGDTNLVITRRAFAPLSRPVTVGWGSNPMGDVMLQPTGLQYEFVVQDFLSGKAIEKAEATSGDASAFSDKDGKILLTLDTTSEEKVKIDIKASGYRTETLTDNKDSKPRTIKMVPDKKQVFISKRSGKYDVYKIDADGKNEKLVLSGSGSEREDMVLVSQPNGNQTALVSTRDNQRNTDGNLLSTLTLIDVATDKTAALDSASSVQVVGWLGDNLVYVLVDQQGAAKSAKNQKIVSYNTATGQSVDIASADYFNSVTIAADKIYYAPGAEVAVTTNGSNSTNKTSATKVGFFASDSSGTNNVQLLNKEIWSITRTDYNTLTMSAGKDWYQYTLGSIKPEKISGAPADQKPRVYALGPDGKYSLWVDIRDGKGVLINYNIAKNDDVVLATQSGLSYPVRWLNETTAVYRIHTDSETADYVVSTKGGEPKKIVDVTNTAGLDRWYYY